MTKGADMTATVQPTPTREDAVKAIRSALRSRSGRAWSVRAGRGSVFEWIYITAPSSRLVDDQMTAEDCTDLGRLLGLDGPTHEQGVMVPRRRRREFVERARNVANDPHVVTVVEASGETSVHECESRELAGGLVRRLARERECLATACAGWIYVGGARVTVAAKEASQ
jgi:hypothetical protein